MRAELTTLAIRGFDHQRSQGLNHLVVLGHHRASSASVALRRSNHTLADRRQE